MKIMLVMGPPGSGKGTQAKLLKDKFNVAHISTGDLFRNELKNKTELGLKAKEFMQKGEYVPDEVTIGMLKNRIKQDDCKKGFILDGFPRTIPQAEFLDKLLSEENQAVTNVIDYVVTDKEVVKRIHGRAKADQKAGKEVRADDLDEVAILKRIKTYHTQTEPVLKYYKDQNKLIQIDASVDVNSILENSLKFL